jgi:putative hemolysin
MDPYISGLIVITLVLIILSGIFSLFNSSLDLCRKSRLDKERSKRYTAVLKTLENPHNITLAGNLWSNTLKVMAAFSACFMIIYLKPGDSRTGIIFIMLYALILGVIITLLGIALPKLIARTKPEKIAAFLLPLMKIFSIPMMPFTLPALKFRSFFFTAIRPEIDDSSITEEELQDELRNTLMEGEKSGVVESKERDMVEGVFYLGDRPVGAFMTHRSEIQWLDINDPYEEIRAKAIEYRHQQCFPVVNGSPDEILGAVYLEDFIQNMSLFSPQGLRAIMKKAPFVPETMSALKAFESFKQGQSNVLFVMDEYGGLAGIISIHTLVEEIVGGLSAPATREEPIILQDDGTWLADGTLKIDDAAQVLSLTGLNEEGDFHTLAGLILHLAGELPHVGDSYEYQGYKFKVIDKDGNRIDKLLITKME